MNDEIQEQVRRLQAETKRQGAAAAKLEAEINMLEGELSDFRARYDQIIAPIQTRLEAIRAAIEELENRRWQEQFGDVHPQESWTEPGEYVPVEEQYRRVWQTPAPTEHPSSQPKPLESDLENDPETRLKHLYRTLARRFHPDLAKNAIDRQYRTRLMTMINEAYAARDLEALQTLVAQGDQADPDEPLAVLRLRQLKQASADLARHIEGLQTERAKLLHNDLMKLKVEDKLARLKGRDLLRDMAAEMDKEYWALVPKLDKLRQR